MDVVKKMSVWDRVRSVIGLGSAVIFLVLVLVVGYYHLFAGPITEIHKVELLTTEAAPGGDVEYVVSLTKHKLLPGRLIKMLIMKDGDKADVRILPDAVGCLPIGSRTVTGRVKLPNDLAEGDYKVVVSAEYLPYPLRIGKSIVHFETPWIKVKPLKEKAK